MEIQEENTFRHAMADGINLFLGAGFPIHAQDAGGRDLPTGSQLAQELVEEFGLPALAQLPLGQLCTILMATRDAEFRRFLNRRFTVTTYDDRYSVLPQLEANSIFTTNIDNLVHRIFEGNKRKYLNDITIRGPVHRDRSEVAFAPLHGCILNRDAPLTFTPTDIASSFSLDRDKWYFLTQKIQQRPTLFWGYSMSDGGVLQALNPSTIRGRSHHTKWVVLRDPVAGEVEYFKALDFAIIRASTDEMLTYLGQHKTAPTRPGPMANAPTIELFPDEAIPDVGRVAVRPIMEFYLGAEPTWHDVFSGQLYKTSHFARIMDAINSGTNTIVLGIPGSGKTTLMMQAAVEASFQGHKLVLDSPSQEKARLVLTRLEGTPALCFIDNFADYIDAFNTLAGASNVVTVGFDREHRFEMASHLLARIEANIVDVTELTDRDLQGLFVRIPPQVRSEAFLRPAMEESMAPSLYEVVQCNVRESNIATRMSSALQALRESDLAQHDLLLMCCYVHSCRTPVSFDMVSAFLGEDSTDWDQVYERVDVLGSLVAEYTGHLVDTEQDHFVARSSILSEAVINSARTPDLRRMLLQFHKNVSPFRICNWDVFRRTAFDSRIISKAFSESDDGKAFYELVYERDQSPYLLQQGALYLSHKKKFREAFSWIDRAVTETQGKIPSIRNSHAVILFRANINSVGAPDVIARTLKHSMDILVDCHREDKRKAYHAMVFGEQALEYWDVYGDDVAKEYLVTASKWLREEEKASPWHRNVRRLSRDIELKLQRLA